MLQKIKITYLWVLLSVFITSGLSADEIILYPSQDITFYDKEQNEMLNPFAGGLMKPQFTMLDLTQNGIEDLVIFDRSDSRIITFISDGKPYNTSFHHAPEYESQFPQLRNFVLAVDFNKNGKKDLFTYSPSGKNGIRLYRNISSEAEGLKFELVSEQLKYEGSNDLINVYLLQLDLPVIEDITGDGAIDILTFGPVGGTVELYKNVSFERYGNYDSLEFKKVDACWGRFEESFFDNNINLNIYYSYCDLTQKNNQHNGATLTALDMTGDGAKDLVIGDIEFSNLKLLINGKHSIFDDPYPIDTMIDLIPNFPENDPVDINYMPAAYYLDINNTGVRDLIVSPFDQSMTQSLNQVWLYHNHGEDNKPDFRLKQKNFLQETMVDLGYNTSPAFFDYNNNGLKDLVIATGADTLGNGFLGDRLVLYENVGTADKPVFKIKDENYLNISAQNWNYIHLAFGDLTNNGYDDLLIGNFEGKLYLFENLGYENAIAKFDENALEIDITVNSGYSAPFIFDYDGDGYMDLILGAGSGNIFYYRNKGNTSTPEFELLTDSLGKILVNALSRKFIYDSEWNVIDTVYEPATYGMSAPVIADITGDGNYELVTGSLLTGLHIYKIDANDYDAEFERINEPFHNYKLNQRENKVHGSFIKPAVYNEAEGSQYIFAGNHRGGLFLFSTTDSGEPFYSVREIEDSHISPFISFPNPAEDKLYIYAKKHSSAGNYKLGLQTLLGQQLFYENIDFTPEYKHEIDVSQLPKGIYLLSITDSKGQMLTIDKIIIH